MNRRGYLQTLAAVFATSTLGGCTAASAPADDKKAEAGVSGETSERMAFDLPEVSEKCTVFFLANDLGRNGYYEQKPIAELMGRLAEEVGPDFIVAAGDTHHFEGVASTEDPLWMTNYELIYSHPELMVEWLAVCGNHEYRGNTQAVLDYTRVSRRWQMPARYYAKTIEAGDEKLLLLFIDTTPLMDKYRGDSETYPDACRQDRDEQLRWIERTLAGSDAKWKVVVGHHPVYAATPKEESERADMRKYLEPLLDRYAVDMYLCGHIHNFQHIKPAGSGVDYLVNSSGSLPRKVEEIEGTRFCSPEAGFTVVAASSEKLSFHLMSGKGKLLYSYSRAK